jgi:hypothetical protein
MIGHACRSYRGSRKAHGIKGLDVEKVEAASSVLEDPGVLNISMCLMMGMMMFGNRPG